MAVTYVAQQETVATVAVFVVLLTETWQQWLRERSTVLSCMFVVHLILSFITTTSSLGRTEPLIQWMLMAISPWV
jgi:hypothetical protein